MKIVWLRRDLRIIDNIALASAILDCKLEKGRLALIYILPPNFVPKTASDWWFIRSIEVLRKRVPISILIGEPESIFNSLRAELKIDAVYWNRFDFTSSRVVSDSQLKTHLNNSGVKVKTYSANLFEEPVVAERIYKVFTPFWKRLVQNDLFNRDTASPIATIDKSEIEEYVVNLETLLSGNSRIREMLSQIPQFTNNWHHKFVWQPGEESAQNCFDRFLSKIESSDGYGVNRDRPDLDCTSRLSPHLAWGEISLRLILNRLKELDSYQLKSKSGIEIFVRELGWRDFSYHILHHFPETESFPLNQKFNRFPWQRDREVFRKWCLGETGYPLIDAGMRQLWQTGWIHNRVRMVVASFLVKHLLIDYRLGHKWFMKTLVDADLASNTLGWQWVSGCGADAAPYFRIFNPVLQQQKFDPSFEYCRRFISNIDNQYCDPIIDLNVGRARALEALASIQDN